MTSILIPQSFQTGFFESLSGTGSTEYKEDGKIVNVKSPEGTNNGAMVQWFFPINPGDEIEFEFFARSIKGITSVGIDLFEEDGTFTSGFLLRNFSGIDFKLYKEKITIPYGKKYNVAGIVLGITNSAQPDSEAEFMLPKLTVNGAAGVLQTIAAGVIQISGGIPQLNIGYKRIGVKNVTYDSANKKLRVYLDRYIRYRFYPIILANVHMDQAKYHASVGTWDGNTNSFELGISDGNGLISLASGVYNIHFEAKA